MKVPELLDQDTDIKVLEAFLPHLRSKTFWDVGAELGSFARFLTSKGFQGDLFEPLPSHADVLSELSPKINCRFFPYALDAYDHPGILHVATDANDQPLPYYHSLQKLHGDERVKHSKEIQVVCRTIDSLINENVLSPEVGIVKIDTEGNDLEVLRGMEKARPEVLVCEFFTKGLYSGWKGADPQGIIRRAEELGFHRYVAVKRKDGRELISFRPAVFSFRQWGNLIFSTDEIFDKTFPSLEPIAMSSEDSLFQAGDEEIRSLKSACDERLTLINRLHEEAGKRLDIIRELERRSALRKQHTEVEE